MRILITIMLIWSSVTAFSQEIWQLSPWAPDSSYVISAMSSGEPTWVKVDSLGVADSIYISGDSIRLRDGAGVAQLPTASTSTKGTPWSVLSRMVVSYKITPERYSSIPGAVNKSSRKSCLFPGWFGKLAIASRFAAVASLSSAARMPLPLCINCATVV